MLKGYVCYYYTRGHIVWLTSWRITQTYKWIKDVTAHNVNTADNSVIYGSTLAYVHLDLQAIETIMMQLYYTCDSTTY